MIEEKKQLYVIQIENIKPEDVIILKSSVPVSEEEAENLKYKMKRYFPYNKVIVLGNSADISIVRPQA